MRCSPDPVTDQHETCKINYVAEIYNYATFLSSEI